MQATTCATWHIVQMGIELQVPSGLLPAMEYKGHLIIESADIMQILEEEFPDYKPLLPPQGTSERSRADGLMVLERRLFSDWLRWLCSSWYTWSSIAYSAMLISSNVRLNTLPLILDRLRNPIGVYSTPCQGILHLRG